jgi:hypothetical protein
LGLSESPRLGLCGEELQKELLSASAGLPCPSLSGLHSTTVLWVSPVLRELEFHSIQKTEARTIVLFVQIGRLRRRETK